MTFKEVSITSKLLGRMAQHAWCTAVQVIDPSNMFLPLSSHLTLIMRCSHVNTGMSRSVTHVLAYLMKHQDLSLLEALQLVREKRSLASPNSGFMQVLAELEVQLHHEASVEMEVYENDRFASSALLQRTSSMQPSNTPASTRERTAPQSFLDNSNDMY
jgi:Dual specificity phosphatase, catalytic domain